MQLFPRKLNSRVPSGLHPNPKLVMRGDSERRQELEHRKKLKIKKKSKILIHVLGAKPRRASERNVKRKAGRRERGSGAGRGIASFAAPPPKHGL